MWLAIHSRSESLSFRKIEGVLPGSGEAVTLFLLTVLTVLLIAPGGFRRSQGVRTILAGVRDHCRAAACCKAQILARRGSHLMALWIVVLVAQLAVAYPKAREKVAVAVLAALGLGGIAAQFYTDGLSMAMLLKYRRPSMWSTGMSITGYKMDGLRFFDNPDSGTKHGDNGRLYATCVNDGVRLLDSSSQQNEKVANGRIFTILFPMCCVAKPATGAARALFLGTNITMAHLPNPRRIFGDADLIMEPHSREYARE